MRSIILILVIVAAVLAFTNPSEADYREHIRKQDGIAGTLGLAVADIAGQISGDKKGGGISRENFLIGSRFYIGGDGGLLPRQNLAWGVAGQFIEIEPGTKSKPAR